MTASTDARNEWEVTELVAPAAYTATQTSAAIDTREYDRVQIVIHVGDWTDGTFTPKIQTSATSGGSYADDDGVQNAFTAVSDETTDDQVYVVDLHTRQLDNPFLKLVVTAAGTTTGAVYGAIIRGRKVSR